MGDAYSDMARAVREHDKFVDSIPDIVKMLETKSYKDMTTEEHDQASSYYRYIESEIKSKFESSVDWYFGSLTRNHFDTYIGNDKLKDYKPYDVPSMERIISDLEKTIDLLKRTTENKP